MHSLFHNDVPFGWTDDKIYKAMKVIFEPLIEKVIHPHSYGWFNSIPGRSAHEALKEILRMRGISWIIEGSLELENFSSNDYQRLAKFFIKYINPDHKDLCFKFFQAACSVSNTKIHPFKQGLTGITSSSKGVISPFVHLLFIPFDEYLEKLKKEFYILSSFSPCKAGGQSANTTQELTIRPSISFVRYADKFIVGVSGNYKETVYIRDLLKSFFYKELGLNLKTNNTNIVHLGSQSAEFLGYYITTKYSSLKYIQDPFQPNPLSPSKEEIHIHSFSGNNKKNIISTGVAASQPRIPRLIINKKAIKEWLMFEGLADEDGKPRYVGKWLYLSDGEIIHRFNRILTRLKTYYLEFSNRGQLHEAGYIIKYSLLHTLAAKHRMSLSKVLAKYVVDKVKLGAKLDKGKTITFSEL